MLLQDACPVWAALFMCIAATPLSTTILKNQPVVDLGYSQYQGVTLSSGVNQYLGMRFAAPPTGDLRFRAPVKPLSTVGVQNATNVCLSLVIPYPIINDPSFNLSVLE